MGIVGSNFINSLAYSVLQKGTNVPLKNLRVRMSCTSRELFSTVDFDPNVYDEVLSLDSFYTVQGLNTLNFDHPYFWDGETNLIFDVCFNGQYLPNNNADNDNDSNFDRL